MTLIIWDSPGSSLSWGDKAHSPQRAGGQLKWRSGEKTQRLNHMRGGSKASTSPLISWNHWRQSYDLVALAQTERGRAGPLPGVSWQRSFILSPPTAHPPQSHHPCAPLLPWGGAPRRGPRCRGLASSSVLPRRISSILVKWPRLYCLLCTPTPARDTFPPQSFRLRAPSCPAGILFHFSKPQNGLSFNWWAKEAHSARGPHITHGSGSWCVCGWSLAERTGSPPCLSHWASLHHRPETLASSVSQVKPKILLWRGPITTL